VNELTGSCLINKYSEGYPGARYYGGNEYIDEIERLAQRRALTAFHLAEGKWHANVQTFNGQTAVNAVLTGFLEPGDAYMSLGLEEGGFKQHQRPEMQGKKQYGCVHYGLAEHGHLNYAEIREKAGKSVQNSLYSAKEHKPKILLVGHYAQTQDFDYVQLKDICEEHGMLLVVDLSLTSHLVAANLIRSPFHTSDIVLMATNKSLGGQRAGLILTRKDDRKLDETLDFAVFPQMQGGPHNHRIASTAATLRFVASPHYHAFAQATLKNSIALQTGLMRESVRFGGHSATHIISTNCPPLRRHALEIAA
jgi:glycine hydroxymethyltransferase